MPGCTLDIRKPVFDGLLKQRKHGFIQLDWRGVLPDEIQDTIDYDLDSVPDFYIRINTKDQTTNLNPFNACIEDVNISTQTSYGWAARVNLRRK
jgi:hypothetical protein